MSYNINKDSVIIIDEKDWPGVFRVAGKVSEDFQRVFGSGKDAEQLSFSGDVFYYIFLLIYQIIKIIKISIFSPVITNSHSFLHNCNQMV